MNQPDLNSLSKALKSTYKHLQSVLQESSRELDIMNLYKILIRSYRANRVVINTCFLAILVVLISWFFVKGLLINIARRARYGLEATLATKIDQIANQFDDAFQFTYRKATWELIKDNVAVYAIQGRRAGMEDRFTFVSRLEHLNTSIYGVFDGHGGEFAAEYVEKALFKKIMTKLLDGTVPSSEGGDKTRRIESIKEVLRNSFLEVDKTLLNVLRSAYDTSGTTAVITLIDEGVLYSANCGDSRAVMCDSQLEAVPLSYDHKPDSPDEKLRIEKAGGFVSFFGVWRVNGILATSRALGDSQLKHNHVVTPEPDIRVFEISEHKPRFMILATDGLWDVFNNSEAVRFIQSYMNEPDFGAKLLVQEAFNRGSLDNISAIVVNLGCKSTTSDADSKPDCRETKATG